MTKRFESGKYTGLILINLQRAFDTIDHEIQAFFSSNPFFQLRLSAAQLSHELSFKCCLGIA